MQRRRPIISTSESKVDKISSLPDEILFRILSFVSTKEAVATSVLSKRWTNLWHYLPNIDFTDIRVNTVESNLRFNEFVYSVLVSREAAGSCFIDSFHLNIQYSDSHLAYNKEFPNLTKWVNSVVQRGLKYLHLRLRVPLPDHFSGYPYFPKLPISIFTCKTLVSLNLSWFRVDGFSFTSVGFEFPSLKTLSLRLIKFSEVRDFMLLLTGCPILEDLHVALVFFYYEEDSHTVQEFKSLTLPKLTKADVSKCWCSCYMVKALSSSVSLCMETSMFYAKDDRVYKANKLQRPCVDIPMFHNLTHLELYNNWDLVVQVLHHCPKLQNLQLYQELYLSISNQQDDQENWVEPEFVPQCLSSYLRTCTIRDCSGLWREYTVAKYILKNAKYLQTMTIWSKREPPEIETKLSPCPKASASCQLSVFDYI